MSDLQDTEPEGSKLKSVADGAATGIGKIIELTGYGAGRVAPTVESACKSIAGLKSAQFIRDNFKKGFQSGYDAAVEAKARKQARSWIASGKAHLKAMGEEVLADIAKWKEGEGAPAPA